MHSATLGLSCVIPKCLWLHLLLASPFARGRSTCPTAWGLVCVLNASLPYLSVIWLIKGIALVSTKALIACTLSRRGSAGSANIYSLGLPKDDLTVAQMPKRYFGWYLFYQLATMSHFLGFQIITIVILENCGYYTPYTTTI